MNKFLTFIFTLQTLVTFGQENLTKKTKLIVDEGKLLYKSEMASWYGTDLFLENYKQRENIGGYFSYLENETSKCVFFSKSDNPKVIGTISFDNTFNIKTANTDLTERDFSKTENDLYQIRNLALKEIQSDTLFKTYKNTSLNIIPLINKKEKKVYILTGPQISGVVIFGNDYLITFDKNNKILTKKELHKNIIPIEYGKTKDGNEIVSTMHNHLPDTGDFITATDICTLMLYEKFAKWKTHNVVSKKYLSIWNCETDELNIIPMDVIEKINNDSENRNENKKTE